jgi:phage tail-like protein
VRGLIEGLASPHPIGMLLPAAYLEDNFAQRLTAGLDDVLAPVFATLTNLAAYVDPRVAPIDFVEWLAGWVGLALDQTWPPDRQRALIRQASDLYRLRGTAKGIAAHVALYLQIEPEIEESGGAAWSPVPGGSIPGAAVPSLKVRVRVPDPASVDVHRLDAVIRTAKPAHVLHDIEVVAA